MVGTVSPELMGMSKAQHCAEKLEDISTSELTDLVKDLIEKNRGLKVSREYLYLAPIDSDLFMCKGACSVLRKREGDEYVAKLTGYRVPNTFSEKVVYYLLGIMPKYTPK
jgi:hypothetical protein